jgi:alkaline phosphatase D
MKRVLHVSDPHHRRGDPVSEPGWKWVEALVTQHKPDLVINTGDLVRDAPDEADDHAHAAFRQRGLRVETLCLPGNHDIGDGPPTGTGPAGGLLSRFESLYGPVHWVRRLDAWSVIGINAMLLGSGQPEEADEWTWLQRALADEARRPIALFIHKPLFLAHPDEPDARSAAIPAAARARFWSLAKRAGVRLIGCGHRHEYRAVLADGILTVWAPTTSTLLEETSPPLPPVAYAGAVEYAFIGDAVSHRPIPFRGVPA